MEIQAVDRILTVAFERKTYRQSRPWIHSFAGIRYSGYVGQVARTKYQLQN